MLLLVRRARNEQDFAKRRGYPRNKRVLKHAREIPHEEIIQLLTGDGSSLSDFFLQTRHGYSSICLWHPQNGSMEMQIEDEALALAAIQYLERQGFPYISNQDELEQLARRNNWSNFKFKQDCR